ncbi:MAG TPA: hypothetical protein VFC77_02935 [Myxococcota bacterium]|nr:hypothetical protein [Myxococcota bacterium]
MEGSREELRAGEALRGREERAALLAAFEADLSRLLPEVRIVDRGLDLSRGPVRGTSSRRADLLALDAAGRPILVLVVDGRGDDTVLAAVNAVAFARKSANALAQPLRESSPAALAGRVALVAESFSARTLEGLELLPGDELLLFEARRVDSAAGSQIRLSRLGSAPAPREATPPPVREDFLARVDAARRGTVDTLLKRLARVDAGIHGSFEEGLATFECDGRELCRLEIEDGSLQGAIPALKRRLPIHGPDDADAFLDEVLREHILLLGEGWGTPIPAAEKRGEEPILTAEEIAAFRD